MNIFFNFPFFSILVFSELSPPIICDFFVWIFLSVNNSCCHSKNMVKSCRFTPMRVCFLSSRCTTNLVVFRSFFSIFTRVPNRFVFIPDLIPILSTGRNGLSRILKCIVGEGEQRSGVSNCDSKFFLCVKLIHSHSPKCIKLIHLSGIKLIQWAGWQGYQETRQFAPTQKPILGASILGFSCALIWVRAGGW